MATAQCLACKSRRNYPLYHWEAVPLSVLGLPRNPEEAKDMANFVMDLRQCAMCGHVFHTEFDYARIPYRTGSNLVYNQAHFWQQYQRELAADWMRKYEVYGKRVVEIGSGEGLFIKEFLAGRNWCFAYEPGPDAETARKNGITTWQEYFQASRLHESRPDVLICRHVLEHLADPLDFLQDIALVCEQLEIQPLFMGEVPRIDKALEQHRINDFLYEHVSNFTHNSFRVLFERAGFEVLECESRYNDEVVTVVARPVLGTNSSAIRTRSQSFRESIQQQLDVANETFTQWTADEKRVALWGGTGKGASMINTFSLTAERFPIVIDSDPRKTGGYVPGTAQRIEHPDYLKEHSVDIILICTQWRARDIEREIRHTHNLDAALYVYHEGKVQELTPELAL